jgi:hypothetical protein
MHPALDYLLCGSSENDGSRHISSWRGFRMNMETRRGRLFHWLLEFHYTVKRAPQTWRLWRADRLMRKAMRLRGETPSAYGFYDFAKGNRAARLLDIIDMDYLTRLRSEDDLTEHRETLNELASICGACWERNP